MPSFGGLFGEPRSHKRHSSTSQKPISQSPPVKPPTTPTASKKKSSASRAQLRPPARQEASPTSSSGTSRAIRGEPARKSLTREDVDVFAFMDDGEEREGHHDTDGEHEDHVDIEHEQITAASSPMSQHHPSSHYSDLEVNADQHSKGQSWHAAYDQAGSFHSDSGISMASSNGDADSPTMQHKYPSVRRASRLTSANHEPSIPEHLGLDVAHDAYPAQYLASAVESWPQWTGASDAPESYYAPVMSESPPNITTVSHLPVTPPELSPQLPRNRRPKQSKTLSERRQDSSQHACTVPTNADGTLKPIYRKFETLQASILLHLQQEIADLEAQLNELEATIAREERQIARGSPASPRLSDSRYPTLLHQRRAELLSICTVKMNVYSEFVRSFGFCSVLMDLSIDQTLSSHASLAQTTSPSTHQDVKVYRKWLKQKGGIHSEVSIQQHRSDFITMNPARQNISLSNLEYSPSTMALTVLIHIMVFKFVPQILARLVMSAAMGMALMCMISPATVLDMRKLKEKKRGVGL